MKLKKISPMWFVNIFTDSNIKAGWCALKLQTNLKAIQKVAAKAEAVAKEAVEEEEANEAVEEEVIVEATEDARRKSVGKLLAHFSGYKFQVSGPTPAT